MIDDDYSVARFDGAVLLLPYGMRERARMLKRSQRAETQEFRLRTGRPPSVLLPEGELSLGGDNVTRKDLDFVLELATGASAHSSREQLREGYITVRGGYRIGVCGSVTVNDGKIVGFGAFSSLCIRISRQLKGISGGVLRRIQGMGGFSSTLIISPPGGGKTTLLRDMVRALSDGDYGGRALRVALADERGEVAAFSAGEAQMDVGANTDVLDSCPKAKAVMMLLRAMNPQVIALDEITAPEDVDAIISAAHCGVQLLATAHAASFDEFLRRPLYKRLKEAEVFTNLIVIEREKNGRVYKLETLA